jgi:hypothetical protein
MRLTRLPFTAACAAALLAGLVADPAAAADAAPKPGAPTRTLDPNVVYVDKVVGQTRVADMGRVQEDRLAVAMNTSPSVEFPMIDLTVTHVLRAGGARADVVERTTIWSAGKFNASNVLWAPVAVVDPFFWLDRDNNPIAMAQHASADQRIKRTMKFVGAPVADSASGVEDFSGPAAHAQLFVDAGAQGASGVVVETDREGHWQGQVAEVLRQLQIAPGAAGQPIRLEIQPISGPGAPVYVDIPADVAASRAGSLPQ